MVRRLITVTVLAGAAATLATPAFALSVTNPGAGTGCVGVTSGTTTVNTSTGAVSNSGTSLYFNGLTSCE